MELPDFPSVTPMRTSGGNYTPYQLVIRWSTPDGTHELFTSYDTRIAYRVTRSDGLKAVILDSEYWDYSRTTAQYRNQFLNERTDETRRKLDAGAYLLGDLDGR